MWKKFKNLKLSKKIIIGIIAIIFLPVTLLLLSIKFLIKSIKAKKKVFSIISIFLVLFMLLVNYCVVDEIILMQDPEYVAKIEAEKKVRDEQAKREKAEARRKAEEEKARKEQEKAKKEKEKAEQKAKKEQEKREKEEAKRKAKEEEARKKAEAKKKAEEEKDRKKAAEEFAKSDLGILTRNNHPTYYGSIKQAKEVWKDVSKDKVKISNGSSGNLKDTTILSIGNSDRNSDLIKYVEIYFNRFSTKKPTTLNEVLKITAEYLPSDIMKKYYSFDESYKVTPKDGREKSNFYVVSYHLNEKGKAEYSKNHSYSGTVDIMIEENHDGSFGCISIKFTAPKWLWFLDKNGYERQKWDCDLMKL